MLAFRVRVRVGSGVGVSSLRFRVKVRHVSEQRLMRGLDKFGLVVRVRGGIGQDSGSAYSHLYI